ncbi:hypothetical protein RchiOBHm_Chr1g0359081 [Rosa chinensis]|uniref:Uncharacterized protein n=1 Tax=Rosa chinensis TaxID=74649 RepID=A0A2P6SIA2_ROSCH|nr:hypothetical protein RchiOBHm_Chr1g0359081 [Rosa chinensis]
MDESCWTPFNLSFPHANEGLMAYTHTKTFSEKELLEHNENSVLELDVVSIACGLLGGDTLLPSMPESMGVLISHSHRSQTIRGRIMF